MAGMSSFSDKQHKLFEARLKRIDKGGPNTAGHIIVGPPDTAGKPKRARRVRRNGDFLSRLGGAFGHLIVAPASFALGAAAVLAGRVGEHHVERAGLPELAEAGMLGFAAMKAEFVIAGLVILLFGALFRLNRGPRKLAVLMGFVAAFILQDAVIATYPDVFARLMPDTALTLPDIAALADI
jgi:hypothetical protein